MLRIISNLISAPVVSFLIVIIFSLFSPIGWGNMNPASSLVIGFLFLTIIPIIPWIINIIEGKVDIDISQREKRTKIYLYAIFSYFLGSVIFLLLNNKIMFLISLSYLLIVGAITLVNLRWKISAHVAGISGPTTAIVYVFGLEFLFLYTLTLLIAAVRLELKAHSKYQVIAGAALSIVLTYFIYFLLW